MATRDLVHLGEAPLFDGTNYAHWKIRMSCYFKAMGLNIWRIVDVGFSPPLDQFAPTKEEEKCLHLNAQAINALFSALSVDVFDAICDLKNVHEMWTHLQEYYERSTSTSDDCIEEWTSGEECSTSSSDDDESSTPSTSPHCFMAKGKKKVNDDDDNDEPSYDELIDMLEEQNVFMGKEVSKFKALKKEFNLLQENYDVLKNEHETLLLKSYTSSKVDIGITCDLLDDLPCIAPISSNSSKVNISTSCDDLIDIPCCSNIDASITSMSCDTNLVEENNELKAQVKKLTIDLERSYKGKATLDEILSKQICLQDKSGIGFTPKKKKENSKMRHNARHTKNIKCLDCYQKGHLASVCPNKINEKRGFGFTTKKKVKSIPKQNGRQFKNIKCFGCKKNGHIASVCPNQMDDKSMSSKKRQTGIEQDKKISRGSKSPTCYNCREKGHFSKECPKGITLKPTIYNNDYLLRKDKYGNVFARMVSSPKLIVRAIWVPKSIMTSTCL